LRNLFLFFCFLFCANVHSQDNWITVDTISKKLYRITSLFHKSEGLNQLSDTLYFHNSINHYYATDIHLEGVGASSITQNGIVLRPYFESKEYAIFNTYMAPLAKDTLYITGTKVKTRPFVAYLQSEKSLVKIKKENLLDSKYQRHFFSYGFTSILFVMLLISTIYYLYLRHDYFLAYSFYLCTLFVFFLIKLVIMEKYFYLDEGYMIELEHYAASIQTLFYVGYFAFLRSFLNTKVLIPKADFLSKIGLYSSLVSFFIMIFMTDGPARSMFFLLYRLFIAVLAVFNINEGLKSRNKLVNYAIMGSSALLIGSLIALFFTSLPHLNPYDFDPLYYFQVGILIELLFFTVGISYKTFMLNNEKLLVSDRLVQSLQENEKILTEKETDLQLKINAATVLIRAQQDEQLRTSYDLREKEMEMNVLRSQINPHFLFNTINALKSLTLQNNSNLAAQYFDEFSQLLRLILENSRSKKITLENELKTLELYVNLENLRLKYKIELQIILDENIDVQFIEVPPTLLQPFVENAIWHGLSHRDKEGGMIKISIQLLHERELYISIMDNGIGREEAEKYKSNNANHHSLATTIINERLALANKGVGEQIKIIDLIDDIGKASGTEVRINILLC
jgi:anti-sigma regulatory factor (Ser/Thr protein kinase)